MGFQFRYEKILKLRMDEEQDRKQALGLLMMRKESIQASQKKLEDDKLSFGQEKIQHFKSGIKASEIGFYQANEAWFKDEAISLNKQLRSVELDIITARLALVKATQEKKKFEKLKDRAVEAFKAEEAYQESLLVDQIVTFNASHKAKGGAM